MRNVLCGTAAAALVLAFGCDSSKNNPPPAPGSTSKTGGSPGVMGTNTGTTQTPALPADAKTPAGAIPAVPTAWAAAATAASNTLAAARARIDEVAAHASTATGEAKTKIEGVVKDLRDQASAIESRITELKNNAADKWEEIQSDVSARITELNRKINDALKP